MNSYYSDTPPSGSQNNNMALASIIAGLGGWLFFIMSWCLGIVLGIVTFGIGNICMIPVWVLILIAWVVSIVTGHIAIKQIKDSGNVEGGRGMAITGLISGYAGLGLNCLLLVVILVLVIAGASIPLFEEILREFSWLLLPIARMIV